ncbi:DUF2380 domain-containing protein [Ancylobacter terrae]|uniref:DUF2380 domain-containing protein n=1 Tax=Ancylobacter sp. sgz301288 TaxID=3342077 RepID=UPI00385A4C10
MDFACMAGMHCRIGRVYEQNCFEFSCCQGRGGGARPCHSPACRAACRAARVTRFRGAVIMSRILLAFIVTAVLCCAATAGRAAGTTVAIAGIDFSDSSGEARDQTPEHNARLRALAAALRERLADSGGIRVVALACAESGCGNDGPAMERLRAAAREEGASLLLVGGVHKMSTLVMSMKLALIEVGSGRVVLQRLFSFRSDNDEGWRRAGLFAAREVVEGLGAAPR